MKIIGIYLGDDNYIPPYTEICLRQARYFNPAIEIDYICNAEQKYFKDINVSWIDAKSINNDLIQEFNEICWFKREGIPHTSYPSKPLFWHRTAERIFYLQAYMQMANIKNVFHFENDNLIYGDLNDVNVNDTIKVLPMSPTHTTFGFCFFPNHNLIHGLCQFMINVLKIGERQLLSMGYDHISEMSLLNIARKNNLVDLFSTLPDQDKIPLYKSYKSYLFDPASYGQYLGGTNNGNDKGFLNCNSKYYIALEIAKNNIKVFFDNYQPIVQDVLNNKYYKLFNLHVHRKTLEDFCIPEILKHDN